MEGGTKRACKRCLIRDLIDKTDLLKTIENHINAIPDGERADSETIETRLAVCKGCDYLMDGMCRACGCYVEIRASRNRESCPYNNWYK